MSLEAIEQAASDENLSPQNLNEIKSLFDQLAHGSFASVETSQEEMKQVLESANRVINSFEKVKLR